MKLNLNIIKSYKEKLSELVFDEERCNRFLHIMTYAILSVVSLVMSIVNLFFEYYILTALTVSFTVLSAINAVAALVFKKKGIQITRIIFAIELSALFISFIFFGQPEGFSAIWMCLLPTTGLFLYGVKYGSLLSGLNLIVLIFALWTPFGHTALNESLMAVLGQPLSEIYTDSFCLRFPFLYTSFYAVGIFMEFLREITHKRLVESEQRYFTLSQYDNLTKIYNRHGIYAKFTKLGDPKDLIGKGIFILDIDFFKKVNDTYGHNYGDIVLRGIADEINDMFADKGMFCRWGGEEFVVVVYDGTKTVKYAEALRERISKKVFILNDEPVNVTISIGAITIGEKCDTTYLDNFIKEADICLYEAKDTGRNKTIYKKIFD